MPYPLNNVETLDSYDDTRTTCEFQSPRRTATVIVANAAVFAQFERVPPGLRAGAGTLEPEEFWTPALITVDRDFDIGRIRFRSAVPGVPAQVSARG